MAEQFRTDPWSATPQKTREALTSVPSSYSITARAPQQAQHTWLAVLSLYFLAPIIAEMLTGATPPLMWNNVGGVILTTGLYGSGAVLARELIRRRGLGWSSLALLGVAYGVLEEGLVMQSWFNPAWVGLSDAARFLEVNWTLALIFTTIHVTLSIMSSVIIAEALFPTLAERPWLGQRSFVGFTLWLGVVASWLFVTYGFVLFHGKGYDHPPLTYGVALLLFVLFLWLGLHRWSVRTSIAAQPHSIIRPVPRLWTLRLAGFAAAFAVLVNLFLLRTLIPVPLIPIALVVGVDLVSVLVVRRWSKRPNWGMRHRLALASGVMGFFIVFSPLLEFVIPHKPDVHMTGLTLVNLLALGGLIWLARRTTRLSGNL